MSTFATPRADERHAAAKPLAPGNVTSPGATTAGPVRMVMRKPSCACGGGCPSCEERSRAQLQAKLEVSHPGDAYEREADAVAEQVLSMPAAGRVRGAEAKAGAESAGASPRVPRRTTSALSSSPHVSGVTPSVDRMLRSSGAPLDSAAREFFEPRFGHDFGGVRVHSNQEAAASAVGLGARAYTVGKHIVFGAGEYTPVSDAGRQLLAHELTHVVQQTSARTGADGVVQRKPTITIAQASSTPPKSKSERQAERSCPIRCCGRDVGTLHAMPLLYAAGDMGPVVKEGDPSARGVSVALHFIRNEAERPAAGSPCHCDDFHIIQVLKTTHPTAANKARGDSYVDVQPGLSDKPGETSPFYAVSGSSGHGEHYIPLYHPDEGEKVKTTESIYDTPFRTPEQLRANKTSLSWMGEACVACVNKNALDRVLGCVTYGFTRNYDAAKDTYDRVVAVHPDCHLGPSNNFIERLANDPLTMHYVFSTAPQADECKGGKGK
jgi:hypothetical protein